MKSSQDFIAEFRNLDGCTIGEKRKSLFQLLKKFQSIKEPITITPKNHLESVFKVEVLIHFRRTEELLEILQNESEELSSKIFKQPWFFNEAFKNYTAEDIVQKILPCTSFVIRKRIITSLAKYCKDELKLDQIFDELLNRYGMNIAQLILPGCSLLKIEKLFKNYEIRLNGSILLPIIKRSPYLLEVYFEESKKFGYLYSLELGKVEKYLASREPDIYFEVTKKYNFRENLGKRTTKKLINHNKNFIILEAAKFLEVLHVRMLIKKLGADNKQFLLNCFPQNIKDFNFYKYEKIIPYFPKNKRYTLISECFQMKYKKTLWDKPEIVNDYLIENIENTQERDKWIAYKISTGSSELDYIQYSEINSAVCKIKEQINLTKSVDARRSLLHKLVDTCRFHNDFRILTDVVKYVCKRHRNDDSSIRNQFIVYVIDKFTIKELNEDIWNAINELLTIQKMNDEYLYKRSNVLKKYFEFLYISKKQFKEEILLELFSDSHFSLDCFNNNFELEKNAVLFLGSLSENSNDDGDKPNKSLNLLKAVHSWNERHRKDAISINNYPKSLQNIKNYVQKVLEENDDYDYSIQPIFKRLICNKNEDNFIKEMKVMYFEKGLNRYYDNEIVLWFLKNQPNFFANYSKEIITKALGSYIFESLLWNYIKRYAHFEFQNQTIQYCLEIFNNNDIDDGPTILQVMAFVMRPEDFVNVISKYIPTEEKMDIQDEDSQNRYKIERNIAVAFKYTKSGIVLPTLLEFCKGDYLGSALESLYYLFYHTPENKLLVFINELAKRAVSVRKHALFLICQVGTIESIFQLLKISSEVEKNLSVKKHLLNTTLNFFNRNPSRKFFDLLKICIPQLHVDDKETLQTLTRISNIPKKYRSEYFIFAIEFLKSIIDKSPEIPKILMSFLSNVDANIMESLEPNICNSFIEEYFLNISKHYEKHSVNNFVSNYIFYCNYDLDFKYQIIFNIINKQKQINSDFSEKSLEKQKKSMQLISDFFHCLTSDFINHSIKFAQKFYEYWLKYFTPVELFIEYISLRIIILQKNSASLNEFAQLLIELFKEIITNYGNYFIKNFGTIVKEYCHRFTIESNKSEEEVLCILSYELLILNQSVPTCMLIFELLPKDCEEHDIYYDILKTLHTINDVSVHSALNMFINDL